MVPLEKLRGIAITEDFRGVYAHYLTEETEMIRKGYDELISDLRATQTNRKALKINQAIINSLTLKAYTDKACNYFLKTIHFKLDSTHAESFSIKSCVKTALEYATSEYLAVSIVKYLTI